MTKILIILAGIALVSFGIYFSSTNTPEVQVNNQSGTTSNLIADRPETEESKPDIFANGGDRKPDGDPVPEVDLCQKLGIEMLYGIGWGGKVQSSSWVTVASRIKCKCGGELFCKKCGEDNKK